MKFKTELTDKEIQEVTLLFSQWWRKNLEVVNRNGSHATDDIFGLPYTSSSDYAGLWNTNADNYYKYDKNYSFQGVLLTYNNDAMALIRKYENSKEYDKYIYIGKVD